MIEAERQVEARVVARGRRAASAALALGGELHAERVANEVAHGAVGLEAFALLVQVVHEMNEKLAAVLLLTQAEPGRRTRLDKVARLGHFSLFLSSNRFQH